MNAKPLVWLAVASLSLIAVGPAMAAPPTAAPAATLVETVRQATERYKDVEAATTAGYAPMSCVSGPQGGAMGIHYVDGSLVGDGTVAPDRPEALLYEMKDGQMRLLGVEYIVLADDWNAKNDAPPVLMGQQSNFVASPNRYGLPAFYELHVWAWQENPAGTFADWNPTVTCDDFSAAPSS